MSGYIPPRDGHSCLWLTVPATESVVDFHYQVIAHAGRTQKRSQLHFCNYDLRGQDDIQFVQLSGGAVHLLIDSLIS